MLLRVPSTEIERISNTRGYARSGDATTGCVHWFGEQDEHFRMLCVVISESSIARYALCSCASDKTMDEEDLASLQLPVDDLTLSIPQVAAVSLHNGFDDKKTVRFPAAIEAEDDKTNGV